MRNRDLDRDRQTKPPKIPILKEFHRQKKPFQTDQHLLYKRNKRLVVAVWELISSVLTIVRRISKSGLAFNLQQVSLLISEHPLLLNAYHST